MTATDETAQETPLEDWDPTGPTEPEPEGPRDPWEPTPAEASAEQAVLGALMWAHDAYGSGGVERLGNPAILDTARVLRPEHMFTPRHETIMRAILDMHDDGVVGIDPLVVGDELQRRGQLAKVGGLPYLHTLLQACLTTSNLGYYAEMVRAAADRRAGIEFGRKATQIAATGDPETIAAQIGREHAAYAERVSRTHGDDLVAVADDAELVDDVVRTWGEVTADQMTTGILDVDSVLNVGRGGLVIIAARSGVGKSIGGHQVARHFALDRTDVAVMFSAEMTRREMYERDLAALARVRLDSATGKTELGQYERDALAVAAEQYKVNGTGLIYDDCPNISLRHIRSRLMQVVAKYGQVDFVGIDYVGICELPPGDREDLRLGAFSRGCKLIAREFECFVALLAQLNRGPESRADGAPRKSDLHGSDKLLHDVDALILIHDVGDYEEARKGEIDWILAKQRKGVSGPVITLADQRHTAQFGDLARPDGGATWYRP